ncbi:MULTISPECIES: MBL fold metallo-hydrolase [Sphingomonas]|nr:MULTISPECIES: MBL fold metallo-hydrolase [Sphingomonas]MBA2919389.1 MBL fold metallo-hydrolase [Sphingomonas sp. CGMCC 1.13658]
MRRWIIGTAGVLAMIAVVAVYWLFYDNRLPTSGSFPIDLAAIRAEAARMPGGGPVRIETETLSHVRVPKIAMVAGSDWSKIDVARMSHRLVFPDRSIVIDTAFDQAASRASNDDSYDPAAWRRLVRAMDEAGAIVITHEHGDHLGGLLASPHLRAILPKALLNPEQFAISPYIKPLRWPPGVRAGYKPFRYHGVRAIAPGVVLIRAPGHTPGSQMIYVRRADGREFLFTGDAASMADNVRLQRIRSRLVTDFFTHENRRAVILQTIALHRLTAEHPQLVLVPGHDGAAIAALQHAGLLVQSFH